MQPSGLFIMLVSVGTVTVLFAWCIWKVLTQPAVEMDHLHAADLHTPDMDEP